MFDYCLRHEHLARDLGQLCDELALPDDVSVDGIATKASERPKDGSSGRGALFEDDLDRKIVEAAFVPEIAHFGYSFDTADCPPILPHPARDIGRTLLEARRAQSFTVLPTDAE